MRRLPWILSAVFLCCSEADEPSVPDPGAFGPFEVGFTWLTLHDAERADRRITTAVWYPASDPPAAATLATYLILLQGRAFEDLPVHQGPYPLVLFSHGNQGIAVQSITFTEHLASQGFIVVAPNHPGNSIFDSPSDEEMAQIAQDRPLDMVFVMKEMLRLNQDPNDRFHGAIDPESIAITGHSFGGFTTLLLAGGVVDVDAAKERCSAGLESDIFCPAVQHFPAGETKRRPADASQIDAALAMAPGGYAAFGPDGLHTTMPILLMGGSLDDFTIHDLRPIYDAVPPPKYQLEIDRAGHMSFTDICRADLAVPELQELCDPAKYLDFERAHTIINTYGTAYLRYVLKGEEAMAVHLAARDAFPEVDWASELR